MFLNLRFSFTLHYIPCVSMLSVQLPPLKFFLGLILKSTALKTKFKLGFHSVYRMWHLYLIHLLALQKMSSSVNDVSIIWMGRTRAREYVVILQRLFLKNYILQL